MRPSLIAIILLAAACQLSPAPMAGSVRPPAAALSPASSPAAHPTATPPAPPLHVRAPILMYHYIRINPNPKDTLGFSLSVTPRDFQLQMDWLQANGRTVVSLEQVEEALRAGRPLPARPVVLTFDDGYADFYTGALPVLRAHGYQAVAYVVTGFLDRPGYLTRRQVREISDAGMSVGSHTISHLDLTTLGPTELSRQLLASRTELENLVDRPVLDFCYPSGRLNDSVVRAVAAAGYRDATTTAPGSDHALADRLAWSRIRVAGGETLAQFAASLASA